MHTAHNPCKIHTCWPSCPAGRHVSQPATPAQDPPLPLPPRTWHTWPPCSPSMIWRSTSGFRSPITTRVKLGPVPAVLPPPSSPPSAPPSGSPSAATQARATLKGCSMAVRVEVSPGLRCTMSSTYTSCAREGQEWRCGRRLAAGTGCTAVQHQIRQDAGCPHQHSFPSTFLPFPPLSFHTVVTVTAGAAGSHNISCGTTAYQRPPTSPSRAAVPLGPGSAPPGRRRPGTARARTARRRAWWPP